MIGQDIISKRIYWSVLSLIALCLQIIPLSAQDNYYHLPNEISSEAQISILTASPNDEAIYTVYGHAGLRVKDIIQGFDITLNYGIFDFKDDFLIRFLSGRTDYLVLPVATNAYINEYLSRGSQITEITLNLNNETKSYLWHYLLRNIEPENRVYRYNFFYDNCSIRLLNIIKEAVEDSNKQALGESKLHLETTELEGKLTPSTWREEINKLEASNPWLVLGTDLALGSQTDEAISIEERCFLPNYLALILPHYYIISKDEEGTILKDSLVQSVKLIGEKNAKDESLSFWRYIMLPSTIMLAILAMLCERAWRFYKKGRVLSKAWDIILFSLTGLAGLLLFYLSFYSEHPHVFPNYNLWVLNPLNLLIAVPFLAIKSLNNWAYFYHFANFVNLVSFILVESFLPQHFNGVIYAISLTLLILSFVRIAEYRKKEHKQRKNI